MCNFTVYVEDGSLVNCNSEIDSYSWFGGGEAVQNILDNSLAKEFLVSFLD